MKTIIYTREQLARIVVGHLAATGDWSLEMNIGRPHGSDLPVTEGSRLNLTWGKPAEHELTIQIGKHEEFKTGP